MMYLGKDAIGLNHMIGNIGQAAIVESGSYTPIEDTAASTVFIPHSLGVEPDFIFVSADVFEASTSFTESYLVAGVLYSYNFKFSGQTKNGLLYVQFSKPNSDTSLQYVRSSAVNLNEIVDSSHNIAEYFRLPYYQTIKLKGGITYHYILGTFNNIIREVTANV